MKKQINVFLIFIVTISILTGCKKRHIGDPPEEKICNWKTGTIFFSQVKLHHPSNAVLPGFKNNFENPIYGFNMFTGSSDDKSKITVTVKGNGCSGTKSKSTVYKDYTNINADWLQKVNTITNISNPEAKIEIVSGPHKDNFGYSGTIIWSKSLSGNPVITTQSGIFTGATFKRTLKSGMLRKIWMMRGYQNRRAL
jgi:hypothetical protein